VTDSKLLPDASFTARIVTPGNTAPVESVITPLNSASWAYVGTDTAEIAHTKINHLIRLTVIDPPTGSLALKWTS